MSKTLSPEKSYNELFEEYGIDQKFRGPEHYRFEALENGELVPVPTEFLIGGDVYALTESGAAIAKDATLYETEHAKPPELDLAARTIIQPGTHLGGRIKTGYACVIERDASITDSQLGYKVHIKTGAFVLNSVIEGQREDVIRIDGKPVEPIEIGEGSIIKESNLGLETTVGSKSKVIKADTNRLVAIGNNVQIHNPLNGTARTKIGERSVILDGTKIRSGKKIKANTLVYPHPVDTDHQIYRTEQGDIKSF